MGMESLEEKACLFRDDEYYYDRSELCGSHNHNHDEIKDLFWLEDNSDDSDDTSDTALYWESQLALLQEILERYQLTGLKLRHEISQIIKEVKGSDYCSCIKLNPSSDCTSCLRRQLVPTLTHKGLNTKLCISKWSTTKKIPAGSHEYIEVVANTISRKKQMTFLIELEFRDQFQIAKAGKEYQKLVSCLPEFYIGKAECLAAIVRVMCGAAKKSMKEKKMHMGPWRKIGFMQMKWSGFTQSSTLDNNKYAKPTEPYLRVSGAPPSVVVT